MAEASPLPRAEAEFKDTSISGSARAHLGNNYVTNNFGSPNATALDLNTCLAKLCSRNSRDGRLRIIDRKGRRIDGTCEWVAKTTQYQTWNTLSSQCLRIIGGPGKGKTMTSIFLAERLETAAKSAPGTVVLQYFCDNNNEDNDQELFKYIRDPLSIEAQREQQAKEKGETLKSSLLTSFGPLWNIFTTMLQARGSGSVYCILDGLDECDNTSIEALLDALYDLHSKLKSSMHFKLIIVSRPILKGIPDATRSFPSIEIDLGYDNEIHQDLQLFIRTRVSELFPSLRETDARRTYFEENLLQKSEGTFLWLSFAVQEMKGKLLEEAKINLDKLPRGLDGMYKFELRRIPIERRDIVIQMLNWTVVAVRPLTLSEMFEAVSMEQILKGQSDRSIREEFAKEYIERCGYIFVISAGTIGLVHQSARDYLLRKPQDSDPDLESFYIDKELAHAYVSDRCIKYLQDGCLKGGKVIIGKAGPRQRGHLSLSIDTEKLNKFQLLSYSALQWTTHARLSNSKLLFDHSNPFFAESSSVRTNWFLTYDYVHHLPISQPYKLLDIAALFGIYALVENITRPGFSQTMKARNTMVQKMRLIRADLRSRDAFGSAMLLAARAGSMAIVKLLLDRGSQIEAKDEDMMTALSWAAMAGKEAVVDLLLERGAQVEAQDTLRRGPLLFAAREGHEAVAKSLLERGAKIEAQDRWGRVPLLWAAMEGKKAVVELLLDRGAHVEAADNEGLRALLLASANGHRDVVELLLDRGALVDAKDNVWDRMALLRAAKGGHEAVVKLLLERGAPVEAEDNLGRRALLWAAMRGHKAVVELLLDQGAQIEGADNEGLKALSAATIYSHNDIVKLLLQRGALVDAKNDVWDRMVLLQAAKGGHEAVLKLSLERGTSVEAEDNLGRRALLWAAMRGYKAVVELLLERGAKVEARDKGGFTALHWAVKEGHESVVKLLLERGAKVEAQDKGGFTALHWAVNKDCKTIAQLLLEHGAHPLPQ